ncbi:MAG: hypothetical protein KJO98_14930, partial [Rhodothermia bacterium]|nr:hypothetical protein [Rhodothermia bacterium]
MTSCVIVVLLGTATPTPTYPQSVTLLERDAVRWSRQHMLDGTISGASTGVLYQNGLPVENIAGDSFQVEVVLDEGNNQFVACIETNTVCSDTVTWTLGYELRPDVLAYATVSGRSVELKSEVVENPLGELAYEWADDPSNPQQLSFGSVNGSISNVTVPAEAMSGEYYFNLSISAGDSVVARGRTFITVTPDSIRAFDIDYDHAAWIDDAVLYEVAPWYFGRYWTGQQLQMIADKIPEIAALGVTGIWLQPITQTFRGGQGYDVTDYFKVWDEIGTEEDLRHLVETAHAHGLKVLFDIVLNHSSLYHPYARDAAEYGAGSYYFEFFQRVSDGAPYSSNYTTVRD